MRTGWNHANEKTGKKDAWGGRARREVESDSVRERCDDTQREKEEKSKCEVLVGGKRKLAAALFCKDAVALNLLT